MGRWRIACAVLGFWGCVFAAQAAAPREPSASLSIDGDAVQPAGAPVILKILIRNCGDVPMSYWCSGPGEYPNALSFIATVSSSDAPDHQVAPVNGQLNDADGRMIDLPAGRSIQFPITLRILAPGTYRVRIDCPAEVSGPHAIITWPAMRSVNVFQVEVRHDNDLTAARDAHIVAGVRADDPFARFVAANWPSHGVREALVVDVSGDDIVAADRAADGLWGRDDPAKVDGPLVAKLVLKHLHAPGDECDVGLMTRLTQGSHPLESNQLKEAMSKLVLARPEGSIRRLAAAALDRPTDAAAYGSSPTRDLLQIKTPESELLTRHDAVALGAMLELAKSTDVHERKLAYRALANFADRQEAVDAIHAGLADPDPGCQNVANRAMDLVLRHRATTQPN